ncbi:5-formyltetrahydrofolate cyclo-ligase [Eubacterium coprostanoligenes]|uniref:5-formyltetrahydrofolate cyclo-ligase n=1 Tax=Eubacterium coprostanoligenes TaxID=290054 RepID=UPI002A8136CD|nr:5-formyltetrahydrofolate cyclo-ligase [Eubacterium coprostanoligenes]MDY4698107.1 5-formyltetrahydrofolate cyclo-ligase [Eubacterium coprostanoligenes]
MKSEAKFSADKKELRSYIKTKRKSVENKAEKDSLVAQNLLSLDEIKKADTVLCYISLDDEICTDEIVRVLLVSGKSVGAPYCVDNNGNMDFYYITDFDDLRIQSFGVREPVIEKCKKVTSFDNTIIILPGLCFDSNGNRLGYGKGYYDRFLQIHSLISVGLCYNSLIVKKVPTDMYDKKADIIVTENDIIRINGGKNG